MSDSKDDFPFDLSADDPLLTVAQAAEYYKVKPTTINKLRREKKIPCVKVVTDARFRRSDLNRYIDKNLSWGFYKHGGCN